MDSSCLLMKACRVRDSSGKPTAMRYEWRGLAAYSPTRCKQKGFVAGALRAPGHPIIITNKGQQSLTCKILIESQKEKVKLL